MICILFGSYAGAQGACKRVQAFVNAFAGGWDYSPVITLFFGSFRHSCVAYKRFTFTLFILILDVCVWSPSFCAFKW